MSFKSLFINSDDDKKKDEKPAQTNKNSFASKFPASGPVAESSTQPAMPTQVASMPITPDNPACAPHLDKIMKLYEDGFNNLNMDGFDFFEYFKMVVEGGVNNPAMYTMAFGAAKAMGASKDSLVSQSQFYIDEINKVYKVYVDNGTVKREEALKAKGGEEANLSKELTDINNEIARLTQLKQQKEATLATIDGKYAPQITDIECKLMANDIARERIVATITTVVDGINKNL